MAQRAVSLLNQGTGCSGIVEDRPRKRYVSQGQKEGENRGRNFVGIERHHISCNFDQVRNSLFPEGLGLCRAKVPSNLHQGQWGAEHCADALWDSGTLFEHCNLRES